MDSSGEDEGEPSKPGERDDALTRIATMLGYPRDAFADDAHDPLGTRKLSELITIWVEMEDDADRERLLEFARQLAASQ